MGSNKNSKHISKDRRYTVRFELSLLYNYVFKYCISKIKCFSFFLYYKFRYYSLFLYLPFSDA